jgi:hypothetical protein
MAATILEQEMYGLLYGLAFPELAAKRDADNTLKRERMKAAYAATPDYFRALTRSNYAACPATFIQRSINRRLLTRYNTTPGAIAKLTEERKGRCAICNKTKKLTIDHCHKQKKVRDLLCGDCNRGLGLFFESVQSLTNAIQYLQQHNA